MIYDDAIYNANDFDKKLQRDRGINSKGQYRSFSYEYRPTKLYLAEQVMRDNACKFSQGGMRFVDGVYYSSLHYDGKDMLATSLFNWLELYYRIKLGSRQREQILKICADRCYIPSITMEELEAHMVMEILVKSNS
jgi:hypothetical protein